MSIEEVRVGLEGDLEVGEARKVVLGGEAVCVARCNEGYFAIADTCSHADVSLSEGIVDPDSCEVECWAHGSLFSLKSGEPLTLPATEPVARFAVVVIDGELFVRAESAEAGR